jgi:hypothetical protein
MAEKSKEPEGIGQEIETEGGEVKFEPVKKIEEDTFDAVKSLKTFLFITIGLLLYLLFLVIPDIEEKVTWIEKDLSSVLVTSERYKAATRVFAKGNACAECHLDPDHLISGLQATHPSFADLKAFMNIGHQKYYTMATPLPDKELMNIYRVLK